MTDKVCMVCSRPNPSRDAMCDTCRPAWGGRPQLRVIEPSKSDAKETLLEHAAVADERYDGVIVIALHKGGIPSLHTSTMNELEKAFLFAFHEAVMVNRFLPDLQPTTRPCP